MAVHSYVSMNGRPMNRRRALFPGTFDPPTLGHLDIIQRASKLCDELYVAVASDSAKAASAFSIEERLEFLKTICRPYSHVKVVNFSGLAVGFAKSIEATYLVRGLRAYSNLESEFRMALANRKLAAVETLFLLAGEHYEHISSTLIREIGMCNQSLELFVPTEIEKAVRQRLAEKSH